jgi:SAM-dependent methyltransferase
MWSLAYRAAMSVLRKHPDLRNLLPSQLYRMLALLITSRVTLSSDRQYMTGNILPALASINVNRVLFVGCKSFTAHYGKQLTRVGIDYWTTDIDPKAAIWGEKDHHIVCDIAKIDEAFPSAWFDVILLNGVFGYGVNRESEMNQAVAAIGRILRRNGMLLIGWNTNEIADPTRLQTATMHFRRARVLPLPLRKTFPDTDHVYDWLAKTSGAGSSAVADGCLTVLSE